MEVARMTNAGNKKLLVVLLALALFACSVMALGGTFATQVDKSGKQEVIDNGEEVLAYEVDLLYSSTENGSYTSLLNVDPFEGTLWCPGYTKVIYFKVVNKENFPVEATFNLKVTENGFDDMMAYTVLAPVDGALPSHATWSTFQEKSSSLTSLKQNGLYPVFKDKLLNSNDTIIYAVAIHMKEAATNQYQSKQLKMDFMFHINSDYKPDGTQT